MEQYKKSNANFTKNGLIKTGGSLNWLNEKAGTNSRKKSVPIS